MVGLNDAIRLCLVCLSKVGVVMDREAGVVGPQIGWSSRWPLKRPLNGRTTHRTRADGSGEAIA